MKSARHQHDSRGERNSSSVAISGTTVVVGSPGPTFVFTKTATGWRQTAELRGEGSGRGADQFPAAIAGSTIVVGSPSPPASVFTDTAAGWKLVAKLRGPPNCDPEWIAISGTTALVGRCVFQA